MSIPRRKPLDKLFGLVELGADHAASRYHQQHGFEPSHDDLQPSGNLATTTPVPPAPPNGAIPLRILVNIAKPFASANTSGGILRRTLNCLPFGALKVEVEEISVPFGVVVPDAGSVTVVGIPSTADTRVSLVVPDFLMSLTCECTENPCCLFHFFREVPRYGPEPLTAQLRKQQLRKRQVLQSAVLKLTFPA